MRVERLKGEHRLTSTLRADAVKERAEQVLKTSWDLSMISDSVELTLSEMPNGSSGEESPKVSIDPKLASELAYLSAEIVKTGELKRISHVGAELVEAINVAAGPYLMAIGMREFKEAMKEGDVWQKLHAIRDVTMGGAGLIEGLKGVSGLLSLTAMKGTLSALGPVSSVLALTHGLIEVGLGARELKEAIQEDKGKLKVIDSLATIALGSLIATGALTHGLGIALGIALSASLKLGIALYERLAG